MFGLLYRLIVQRVQEYKAKRRARKDTRVTIRKRQFKIGRRRWIFAGVFFAACSIVITLAYRWQLDLPILNTSRDTVQLDIEVAAVKSTPLVLYLEKWPQALAPVAENDNVSKIVIRENQFVPRFQIIAAGSTVEILNEDPILHNTHLDDGHNTVFNVATPLRSITVRKTLTATGILNVRCDLHPTMYGWAFVPPSAHYAVMQEPGTVSWADILPGDYRLVVWQPEAISRHRLIQLNPGQHYAITHE